VPNGDDPHLDASDVQGLLAGTLPATSRERVLGHFFAGCGVCRERLREEVLREREARPEPVDYDAAFDAAIVRSAVAIGEVLADLEGEALAVAANAHRLAGRCGEVGRLLRQAAGKVGLCSGDPLLAARLLAYQGSLWQTLGRFERAARAFERAEQVYRRIGERHLAARSLARCTSSTGRGGRTSARGRVLRSSAWRSS
jgi:hypothetical protein